MKNKYIQTLIELSQRYEMLNTQMNDIIENQRIGFIMMRNNLTFKQVKKIREIISQGVSHFQTDDKTSDKNLMRTLLEINISNDSRKQIKDLMSHIKYNQSFTTKELNNYMWNTITSYYYQLEDINNSI